jgi:hypothetical protein
LKAAFWTLVASAPEDIWRIDVDSLDPTIITTALATATIAKILVDLVRATQRMPAWASPLLALGFSIIAAFLLQLAGGGDVTLQTVASDIIAGILAAGTAVGTTELQKRGQQPGLIAITADVLDTRQPHTPHTPRT